MPYQAPNLYRALQDIEGQRYRATLQDEQSIEKASENLYLAVNSWYQEHPKSGYKAVKELALLYPN
jgi:hypothetical protein